MLSSETPPLPSIQLEAIDPNALDVTQQLQAAGHQATLVGGCVRDLLLGVQPKDFDVATNATPEEVKALFRRARTVGRRFRIVHVRYGRNIIEVSTFRKTDVDEDDDVPEQLRSQGSNGVILRDNLYGTLEEDAFRRDFTVNGLYFNPADGQLIDYVDGLEDLEARQLRLIGDPDRRLREDPVRILRAVRFKAKLGFEFHPSLADAIPDSAELLCVIPPARLFDEFNKLFLHGYAERAWTLLGELDLTNILFPTVDPEDPLVACAMRNTDERVRDDKPVTPGFLLAALLWNDYQSRAQELMTQISLAEARNQAAMDCLREQSQLTAIPRRFSQFAREVWQHQQRLEKRQPRNMQRVLGHVRFRAAYDFLVLRAQLGHVETELADWWSAIQDVDSEQQKKMIGELSGAGGKKRRRRRRPRSEQPSED